MLSLTTKYLAVMGDAGKLYVAADVIPVYRQMLPLARIITPNWFEVEYVYHSTSRIILIPADMSRLPEF
jgi:pyridoxal/pyridoxine/pyridoxamine kinase